MAVLIAPKKLAEKLGVTSSAVTKNIRKWRADGEFAENELTVVGRRVTAVSEAKYRLLYSKITNPNMLRGDEETPSTELDEELESSLDAEGKKTLADLKLREKAVDIEIKELKLAEAAGKTIRVDKLLEALIGAARSIQASNTRLENKAEKLEAAFRKDGQHGLRIALREIGFEQNDKASRALMAIAKEAEEGDDLDFD